MLGRQTEIKAGDRDGGLGAETPMRFLLSVREENRSPLVKGATRSSGSPEGCWMGKDVCFRRFSAMSFFNHVPTPLDL